MKIWYMRDNHTFRLLTKRANPIIARGRFQEEFNKGWKHGLLFSREPISAQLSVRGEVPENIDDWLMDLWRANSENPNK